VLKVLEYYERNSVNKDIVQHIVFLNFAIGEIHEIKKVQTENGMYFAAKDEIIIKVNTVQDGTIAKDVKYRYILHNFTFPSTLKILTTVSLLTILHFNVLTNKNTFKHKKNISFYHHTRFNANIGGSQRVAL
jgi:hypothetical protein